MQDSNRRRVDDYKMVHGMENKNKYRENSGSIFHQEKYKFTVHHQHRREIRWSKESKYLGIILDRKLTYAHRIKAMKR